VSLKPMQSYSEYSEAGRLDFTSIVHATLVTIAWLGDRGIPPRQYRHGENIVARMVLLGTFYKLRYTNNMLI
jgi:hypothetical protein